MTEPCVRVLLVEDSPTDAFLIQQILLRISPRGFDVALAGRLDEAIGRLRAERFDVVLLDLGLPDSTGIETLVRASAAAPQMPIVVLTGADDEAISSEAIRRGSQDYLFKSHVDGQIVANSIRYAVQRKKAEAELKSLNEELERRVAERTAVAERRAAQLRQLATELTLAEQRERQRLARILHDGLQQTLVAAKFNLKLVDPRKDVRQVIADVTGLIDEAIETSRSMTAELSPPMLHQGGLIPSLNWLVRWLSDRHGLTTQLTAREDMEPMPEEVIIPLFQSIREILFNVVKHAGVKTARVEVMQREGWIYVSIEDEGAGFDPSHLRAEGGSSGGFGLFSISERLSLLGGHMDVHSAPGRGSRLSLVVPYAAAAAEPLKGPARTDAPSAATSAKQVETAGGDKKIRILLADDHVIVRQGLAVLLRAQGDMEVVGEASHGDAVVTLVREKKPDVVLMDIDMPGMDGIEATRKIHREFPGIRIIGLSMFEADERAAAIKDVGAVGYVTKGSPSDTLLAAVRACVRRSMGISENTVWKSGATR